MDMNFKLTSAYKGKADGSKMKCHYDEKGFARRGMGSAGWYHPIVFGADEHIQKGVFGVVIAPTYTKVRVIPTEGAEKIDTEIGLEYMVHERVKISFDKTEEQEKVYKLSAETELYIPQ